MVKRRFIKLEKKNIHVAFNCDDSLFMALEKTLMEQKPQKYDSLSHLLRVCIVSSLPSLAKDVGVDI